MTEEILAKIFGTEKVIIQTAVDLINIPSVTSNVKANRECLDYLATIAEAEGMKTAYTRKKDCLVIKAGKGPETLGILAHVDVVDPGDINKWETPPFKGIFDGNAVIGRGAQDDKVPVAIIFNILRVMNKLDLNCTREMHFIVGTREEETWTDMENYLNEFKPPDFSFSPDGAFPVHNIEKGYADVEIAFPLDPTFEGGEILALESGSSPNIIPSRGRLLFKKSDLEAPIEIDSSGISAHSSLPQQGENALAKLAWRIRNMDLKHPGLNRVIDFISQMDNDYNGKFLGFDNEHNYYKGEYVGETLANPTVLKYDGRWLTLNINIRHKLGVDKNEIIALFCRHGEEVGFNFRIVDYQDPLYVEKDQSCFEKMNRVYELSTGLKGGFAIAGGTSYAKALPNTVSWGPVLPGDNDTSHQENEKINLGSIIKCIEIYGRYLYEASTG